MGTSGFLIILVYAKILNERTELQWKMESIPLVFTTTQTQKHARHTGQTSRAPLYERTELQWKMESIPWVFTTTQTQKHHATQARRAVLRFTGRPTEKEAIASTDETFETRMHSSRMRTSRCSVGGGICQGDVCPGGVCLGVCVCLPGGV